MAINTTLASLSQNAALNGPVGATDPPAILDDGLRYALSFIAQLRDGVGFKVGIGGPVKIGQNTADSLVIGYSTSLSKLIVTNDGNSFSNKWPIDISGKADTAAAADTATTATNANQLGGAVPAEYVKRASVNDFKLQWDVPNGRAVLVVDGVGRPAYSVWAAIPDRPTNLNQFSNGPGYQTSSDLTSYAVQRIDSITQLGNVGTTALRANINGFGFVAWGVTPSDARLKKDVEPTREDSLYKISQINFRQFRFRSDATQEPIDDGRLHRLGVIAQELETLDPAWVNDAGTWRAPDQQTLLYAALHAIQQLRTRIVALEGRA
ncbi:tail fiber domain-containing protein [Variovorax paradoxus]|uniref:tail fiber domain-containing protein n=1 Tax=Variovorax paradoxus TaxID=34073 RepID=UPI001ABCB979